MKDTTISITVDKAKTFIGGENVFVSVELSTTKPLSPTRITLSFVGKAKTLVMVGSGDDAKTYSETRIIINDEVEIWKPKYGTSTSEIQPGSYHFTHIFTIPNIPNLAPTLEIDTNSVRYRIKARVHLPSFTMDPKAKESVKICPSVDANLPDFLASKTCHNEKTVCCWWCASDPITVEFSIPTCSIVWNESTPITLTITNMSGRSMTKIRFYISRVFCFKAKGHSETHYDDFTLDEYAQLVPHGSADSVMTREIQIPSGIAPTYDVGDLVTLQNSLMAELVLEGMTLNLHVGTLIVLGTFRSNALNQTYLQHVDMVNDPRIAATHTAQIMLDPNPLHDNPVGNPKFGSI